MIKSIEFKDKEFNSKSELFKSLKDNKQLLIDAKKSTLKCSDSVKTQSDNGKATVKELSASDGFVIAVINTTNYLDSHNDVHMKGIWNKSINEQANKIYYVTDHELAVGNIIVDKSDLKAEVKEILWKDLGADFDGSTEALLFNFKESDVMNASAKNIIDKRKESENSVRMQYVTLKLAIDDDGDEYKEEKAVWDKYISTIANKSNAIEQGYFWAVEEAKIYKEGSMVIAGSNDITPMIYSIKDIEPPKGTQEKEPPESTQTKLSINNFI